MAVIRGESCFEKNAFDSTSDERISCEIFEISKKFCIVLKLLLRPILFHGKLSFDNLIILNYTVTLRVSLSSKQINE